MAHPPLIALPGGVGAASAPAVTTTPPATPPPFGIAGPTAPPRRFEVASAGIDESLQLVESDPYGGRSWWGLRVPTLATPAPGAGGDSARYLFNLSSVKLGAGQKVKLLGWRFGWALGALLVASPDRIVEQVVEQPAFKLPDGNVSFHLRFIKPGQVPQRTTSTSFGRQNAKFLMSDTPALLYKTINTADGFYVNLNAYTPPNKGRPWGAPLAQVARPTFYDQPAGWTTFGAWQALETWVTGPGTVALFASVRQSAGNQQIASPPPPFFPEGLSKEEQFLLNFPAAIIWRVAGALAWQEC